MCLTIKERRNLSFPYGPASETSESNIIWHRWKAYISRILWKTLSKLLEKPIALRITALSGVSVCMVYPQWSTLGILTFIGPLFLPLLYLVKYFHHCPCSLSRHIWFAFIAHLNWWLGIMFSWNHVWLIVDASILFQLSSNSIQGNHVQHRFAHF